MLLALVVGQPIGDFRGKAGLGRIIGDGHIEPARQGLVLGRGGRSTDRPHPQQEQDDEADFYACRQVARTHNTFFLLHEIDVAAPIPQPSFPEQKGPEGTLSLTN